MEIQPVSTITQREFELMRHDHLVRMCITLQDKVSTLELALSSVEAERDEALSNVERAEKALAKRQASKMLGAVRSEVEGYRPELRSGTLAQGAYAIAEALDAYTATAQTAAELSAIVKALQELRMTLGLLRRAHEDAEGQTSSEDDGVALSTPVRDAAK